ncbi:hypothetical protein FNJ84_20515 [Paracoccus sp. M683]|nr:hypothetical protein FNJ84_20515 [Paracoccus sp. M683]
MGGAHPGPDRANRCSTSERRTVIVSIGDFDRQVADVQVRVGVRNGATALGTPLTEAPRCPQSKEMGVSGIA